MASGLPSSFEAAIRPIGNPLTGAARLIPGTAEAQIPTQTDHASNPVYIEPAFASKSEAALEQGLRSRGR